MNKNSEATPIVPIFKGLRQKDHELEASLGYIENPCLKMKKKEKKDPNQTTKIQIK